MSNEAAPTVDVKTAAGRPEGVTLVDVREPEEWASGHAPNAIHMPLGTLGRKELPPGMIYFVCRSGGRSGQATAAARAEGHDAYNVEGGMQAWEKEGLSIITDSGDPGTVA